MAEGVILTAGELIKRCEGVPLDARVYVYVGPEGVRVQAEWNSEAVRQNFWIGVDHMENEPGHATLIEAPSVVPAAGGACI